MSKKAKTPKAPKREATLSKEHALELAQAQLRASVKKRIGRPTKKPSPGERVPLGLRVTPEMKERLERAATRNGRSISQEAEMLIERSLGFAGHLIIAHGEMWAPILVGRGDLLIGLGYDPRDYPVPPGAPPHQETFIRMKIEPEDLRRLGNYLGGAPWPYDMSNEEIEEQGESWLSLQTDIRRGK